MSPRTSNPKLLPESLVYSVNTICRLIDIDRHCWISNNYFRAYLLDNQAYYTEAQHDFILEYINETWNSTHHD